MVTLSWQLHSNFKSVILRRSWISSCLLWSENLGFSQYLEVGVLACSGLALSWVSFIGQANLANGESSGHSCLWNIGLNCLSLGFTPFYLLKPFYRFLIYSLFTDLWYISFILVFILTFMDTYVLFYGLIHLARNILWSYYFSSHKFILHE